MKVFSSIPLTTAVRRIVVRDDVLFVDTTLGDRAYGPYYKFSEPAHFLLLERAMEIARTTDRRHEPVGRIEIRDGRAIDVSVENGGILFRTTFPGGVPKSYVRLGANEFAALHAAIDSLRQDTTTHFASRPQEGSGSL